VDVEMRLVKWLKGLHFHKWELVYTGKYITKYFYKCSICGEYRYNFNTSSEKHISDKSELDSAIEFDLWVVDNMDFITSKSNQMEIVRDLKAESKRRCRKI
jgi:hypothetical protein